MKKVRRTNQGGSAVIFVLVSLALTFGLISAVYILNARSEQARKDQAIALYEEQQTEKESELNNKTETETNKNNNVPVTNSQEVSTVTASQALPTTGTDFGVSEISGLFMLTTTMTEYLLSRRRSVSIFDL